MKPNQPAQPSLSPRQMEVLKLCADGMPIKVIARHLGITPDTVKDYRCALMARFGTRNIVGAVAQAFRLGVLR